MAEDTLYLCKFRVSVEGDWLCLRELDDIHLEMPETFSLEDKGGDADPAGVERTNLLNLCKLVVKELLDQSLCHGGMLDGDHLSLQQFFDILDHVLYHCIKPTKGVLREKREFWPVLEQVEKYMPDARDITASVRDMPNVRSSLGRSRSWLRLALMKKRLADYFLCLVDKREALLQFYEEGAVMLHEEAAVIAGLLLGLNVIDCNIAMKDEDLDKPMGVIDFSLYKDEPSESDQTDLECKRSASIDNVKMAAILDQKNYLEELNRHLNATVTNLQQKLENMQTVNTLMKEDLAVAKNNIIQLQEENRQLKQDNELLLLLQKQSEK